MKNKKNILILILVLGILLTACSTKENNSSMSKENPFKKVEEAQDKKTIYVSNYPYYDFTKAIVKDKIDIVNLTKNQGFHNWEPSAKDLADLQNSSLFIYSGPGLERWADDLIEKNLIGGSVLALSDGLDLLKSTHTHDHEEEHEHDHEEDHNHDHEEEHDHEEDNNHDHNHDHDHEEDHNHDHEEDYSHDLEEDHDHDHDHDHGEFDPHIWLSLKNAQVIVENIKNQVSELDPANADFYEENYKELSKKLKDLDEKYEETLKNKKRDEILVSHEAYGYLCRDYGFKQTGIEGINPQGEPSLQQIDNIIKLCKEKDLKVIFYEESISPKVADLIAHEVGASLELLSPIEVLSKEQMDAGKDYFEIMEDNLEGLDKALNE